MQEEIESLYKNETWELHELPKDRRALTAKLICKRKKAFSTLRMQDGKHVWLFETAIRRKVLTSMRYSLL